MKMQKLARGFALIPLRLGQIGGTKILKSCRLNKSEEAALGIIPACTRQSGRLVSFPSTTYLCRHLIELCYEV